MLRTYCINLDRRTDRWHDLQANCAAHGLSPKALTRWSAVAEPEFGALGVAKSQTAALAHFLTQDSSPYALILEDDFDFVRPFGELIERFDALSQQRLDWDVLMLMGTAVMALPQQPPGVARVVEAQSAAGYLVSRRYAATVLGCFAESIVQMEQWRGLPSRAQVVHRHAIDQVWKPLQRRDRWYIFNPAFGRQRPSFSDIEGREVNYDAMTYGLATAA